MCVGGGGGGGRGGGFPMIYLVHLEGCVPYKWNILGITIFILF